MKDVFDIEWIIRQYEFNLKYADGSNQYIFEDFGCDKLIKQALHEEFLQAFSPTLPAKAFNNFILNIKGYFYERFNLDDMKLKHLGFQNGDFILEGDIQDYVTEEGLIDNLYKDGILFRNSKIRFEKVKNIQILNCLGEKVYLTEPFKYPVDLLCGCFEYNISQKKHKYTVYLKSLVNNKNAKEDILSNIGAYLFQINFEYEDIDLFLGPAEILNKKGFF